MRKEQDIESCSCIFMTEREFAQNTTERQVSIYPGQFATGFLRSILLPL